MYPTQTFNDILGYAQYEHKRNNPQQQILLFLHRKAGRLILVPCSREREGQIGSWPTAQAETSNLRQVCHKSGNHAFKGPETLDMALDTFTKINTTKTSILRLHGGVHLPPDTNRSRNARQPVLQNQEQPRTLGKVQVNRTQTTTTQY